MKNLLSISVVCLTFGITSCSKVSDSDIQYLNTTFSSEIALLNSISNDIPHIYDDNDYAVIWYNEIQSNALQMEFYKFDLLRHGIAHDDLCTIIRDPCAGVHEHSNRKGLFARKYNNNKKVYFDSCRHLNSKQETDLIVLQCQMNISGGTYVVTAEFEDKRNFPNQVINNY